MKVSVAAKTLSSTTATAIEFYIALNSHLVPADGIQRRICEYLTS